MKLPDLNLLVALDALLDTTSVTEAAKRMHLSAPAMSHTLARIRAMVGDPILVRAGRKLVPTPRALELMEPVNQLLAQARAVLSHDTPERLRSLQRTFVIRAPEGVSVVFGAPLSQAVQEVMAAASIRFLSEGQSESDALRRGLVDLDIGAFHHQDPEIEVEQLTEQRLVGAASRGHPLLRGKLTAKRLAAQRHVGVTLRQGETSPLDDALALAGLARFVAMTVHSTYGALIVAARSQLVASAPEVMAQTIQAVMALEIFELPLPLPKVPMTMAWHPRYNADPAHSALRACVRRVLHDQHWQRPRTDIVPQR